MTWFAETTKRCAFTDMENHLTKLFKGRAFAVVKGELHKHNALPSVLATIRVPFGQSVGVYRVLVNSNNNGFDIKDDDLETFLMSVKTLCDTRNTIELQHYFTKLPGSYRMA